MRRSRVRGREQFPIRRVRDRDQRRGLGVIMPLGRRRPLMRAAAVGTVAHRAGQRGAEAAQQQAEADASAAPPPPPPPPPAEPPAEDSVDSPVDRIKQLAELHASGVLTDDEFSAAKAKALGIT
jgi:hypothetical protein